MKESPKHIFISYASEDLLVVSLTTEKIEKEEIIVWRDSVNLNKDNPGEKGWQEMEKQIEDSEHFVIFLSKNSVHKKSVIRELEKANAVLEEGKKSKNFIVPMVLDEYAFKNGVKDELGNPLLEFEGDNFVHGYKCYPDHTVGIDRLANFLLRKLKPIFELEKTEKGLLSYKFFYKIDDVKRSIIFKTFFILDSIHDTNELVYRKINLFNFRTKKSFKVEGTYFTIKLEIAFSPWLGTISEVKHSIIANSDL